MSGTTFNVQDFYHGDWSAAFVAALASANHHDAEIRFPDATLDFASVCGVVFAGVVSNHDNPGPRHVALPVFNAERISLVGGPRTLLRFNGHTVPLLLHKSRGIRVQSLKIDWAEPFYSQGRVRESAEDYFDLAIDSGYPYDVADQRLLLRGELCWGWGEIDPTTLELLPGRRLNCGEDYPTRIPVEDRGGGVVRFHGKVNTKPVAGSIMALRHGKRETPAVVIDDCADVALDSLWIYHAGGMGVIAQNSRDVRLDHVQVTPPPGSGRAFSTCADATHFVNCSGEIAIEHCLFERQFDDGSNIHGVYAPVLENSGGRTLLAELRHPQHRGLSFAAPGDRLRAVDGATLRALGEVSVEAVQEHPDGTFQLEVNAPLPAGTTVLESLTRRPTSTRVAHNVFRGNNPRGILVSVPGKVVVEDNFFSSPYSAILIAADAAEWFESGAVEDVTIRRNRFSRCGYGHFNHPTVYVHPQRQAEAEPAPLHGHLTLEDNQFDDCPPLVASVTAFQEVVTKGNRFPVGCRMELNT